ncbi:T-cell differentiation antigen CD6-like isoform X3 [Myxocyprinus asiaticus]|uniref:T-cell differentiation antigen CD6-like isoform X3 n=1 Tax=Myxocyprinus asiaticus TaxID=70543 RepID=UPI002222FF63|nr:T-cell differentiation antigen CD6-like isoform X3 [Myxocyprinus asiaticus]
MLPLLLYIVLQAVSLSQGLNSTDDLPPKSVANADHSDKQIEPSMLSLSRGCSGVVRALHQNTTVDVTLNLLDSQEKKQLANQICESLGCGQVFEHGVTATVRSGTCLAGCILRDSKLQNCTTDADHDCTNATEIICEHQAVRLVGGHDRCAGRVELLLSGYWGTVCDDNFDMRSGNVVCAQLNCGIAKKLSNLGAGTGPIYISKMKCKGSESNLWVCNLNDTTPSNYCGHKEDAGVVCSESTEISPTTDNTTKFITHTAETTAVSAMEPVSRVSAAAIGCFILSILLLLFILSNATVYVHFKRGQACAIPQHHSNSHASTEYQSSAQIGTYQQSVPATGEVRQYEIPGPRPSSDYAYRFSRRTNRTSHNSDSSADSNYEHHNSDRVQRLQNNLHIDANYSSSTSSGEGYENAKTDMNNILKSQFLNDSDSTSSGEWYENTKIDMENNLQSDNEENPSLPEKSLQTLHSAQMTANTAAYGEPHLPNSQVDVNDSDSTSSGECYQNIDADTFLQPGKESPSLPEQTLLNHHSTQMTGSTAGYEDHHAPGNLSQETDNISISSEASYVNVPPIKDSPEREVSSDSNYDQAENW